MVNWVVSQLFPCSVFRAEAFFCPARTVTGHTPARVTSDGHDAYPGAIKATLGAAVRQRASRSLPNPLAQDHRGIRQRIRPMGGVKSVASAQRLCRVHDEVRHCLRPRLDRNEVISLAHRRLLYTTRMRILLTALAAAETITPSEVSVAPYFLVGRVLTKPFAQLRTPACSVDPPGTCSVSAFVFFNHAHSPSGTALRVSTVPHPGQVCTSSTTPP